MRKKTHYIYICGAGFSGSTLLSLVLNGLPQVSALGEVTHYYNFRKNGGRCSCGKRVGECSFWKQVDIEIDRTRGKNRPLDPHRRLLPYGPEKPLLKHWLQMLAFLGDIRLLSLLRPTLGPWKDELAAMLARDFRLFDSVRKVSGKPAVVDASKFFLRMKLLYLQRQDAFRTIHLVRDGRGVLYSNLKRGMPARRAVLNWVKSNTATLLMLKTVRKDRHLLVRYESFCEQPDLELRRICHFLDLQYVSQALKFRNSTHHIIRGNRMRFASGDAIVNPEEWKKALTYQDLKTFERYGARLNQRLGYR